MTTRTFTTADAVSGVCGVLVTERGMDAVYEVLSFLHGRDLFTHELPNAMRYAMEHAEIPEWMRTLDTEPVNRETWREWIAGVVREHGDTVTLTPLSWSAVAEKNPVDSLVEMVGKERVIVVETGEEPSA